MPTRLAELGGAAALPGEAHDGHHLGPQARVTLLAAGAQGAHGRVRLAAVILLQ